VVLHRCHFDQVSSTQDEARRVWKEKDLGPTDLLAVTASTQAQGRGRQGRVWHSQSAENLYLTVAFDASFVPQAHWSLWPLYFAELVWEQLSVEGLCLKWPNDLVFLSSDRFEKCGGILIEVHKGTFFCGLGLNWTDADFQGSRALFTRSAPSKEEWVEALLESLQERRNSPQFLKLFQSCPERLWRGPMAWMEGWALSDKVSRVHGLGTKGELLAIQDGKIRSVVSGELRLLNPKEG
jgi:biotin-[acetyl-CoA-carboxylase] ligase BirA-like protein